MSNFDPNKTALRKYWAFPKPKDQREYEVKDASLNGAEIIVNQQKFYDEYHVSGHKVFDEAYFPNLMLAVPIDGRTTPDGKQVYTTEEHRVRRVGYAIQQMACTALMAHLFGNDVEFTDSKVALDKVNEESLTRYKQIWLDKNMETAIYRFGYSLFSMADSAIVFSFVDDELHWRVWSRLDGDDVYGLKDPYGNTHTIVRKYMRDDEKGDTVEHLDVLDSQSLTTYTGKDGKYTQIFSAPHGFRFLPAYYYMRRAGAVWTEGQVSIDTIELMMSLLSEDNRTKSKGKYFIATDNPDDVETFTLGSADVCVSTVNSEMKLIHGADISTSFKFEFDTHKEVLYNTLGVVFPEVKSSGDMPTGSMKLLFYPSERMVTNLAHEFNEPLNKVAQLFRKCLQMEYPEEGFGELSLNAWIKVFTPQDDSARVNMVVQAKGAGVISEDTAIEEIPFSKKNEKARLGREREEAAHELRALERLRVPVEPVNVNEGVTA